MLVPSFAAGDIQLYNFRTQKLLPRAELLQKATVVVRDGRPGTFMTGSTA